MNTDHTPYEANLITKLRFFIKVSANKGANIISDRYCLLNLSNTK